MMLIPGLCLIFFLVLLGPFTNRWIERNLEVFLFAMGLVSATISQVWSHELVQEGLIAPINITLAVLGAGVLFHYLRERIDLGMKGVLENVPLSAVICFGIIVLGLLSSVISAIIAALILVEFINVLPLHRRSEVNLTIISCFAIGVGAALTPLGEPLSTIVVSKLSSEPHHATFFYLARLLGFYAIALIIILGILGSFLVRRSTSDTEPTLAAAETAEKLSTVFLRATKVYVFVMALIFLGAGFKPLIDLYLVKISSAVLFWANVTSAILDNATLAAAEIGPTLREAQIKSALWGLLISGGMLIPGNIPNIIAAHSLNIKSTEWAGLGVPLGFVLMVLTAALLLLGII
jgi:predicted cation transporter